MLRHNIDHVVTLLYDVLMQIATSRSLEIAGFMDTVALAREDSVCQMLQNVAVANGWDAERECGVTGTRERIDLVALRPPMSSVIIETKKGYAPSRFLEHVAQAARYRARYNSEVVRQTRKILESSMNAVQRSASIGHQLGSLLANDALLVCPSFDAKEARQHAFEAADQGVLAVNTIDAVLYLSGHPYNGCIR